MEKITPGHFITCKKHPTQYITGIFLRDFEKSPLACTKCILENIANIDKDSFIVLEDFIVEASKSYEILKKTSNIQDPVLQEVIDETLNDYESLEKLTQHIETEKTKVTNSINTMIQEISVLCLNTRDRIFEKLDQQLATVKSNYSNFRRKVDRYCSKEQDDVMDFSTEKIAAKITEVKDYDSFETLIKMMKDDIVEAVMHVQSSITVEDIKDNILDSAQALVKQAKILPTSVLTNDAFLQDKIRLLKDNAGYILEDLIEIRREELELVPSIPQKEWRCLMLGLDGVGKTSILYWLKIGGKLEVIPTVGFNVETIQHQNHKFTFWDLSGAPKLRPHWVLYYSETDALIFVVDCSDNERIETVKKELQKLLREPELEDAKLLIYANKQDLNGYKPVDLVELLGLVNVRDRDWFVQGCSVSTGEGISEGLDWLAKKLSIPTKKQQKMKNGWDEWN